MHSDTQHKQLFKPLKGFEIFDYFSSNEAHTKSGHNIPFVYWPDGSPCLIANLYIIELLSRRSRSGQELSRRGSKCGTLGEYALQFGQLINFCYRKKLDLIDLTDSTFTQFIYELRAQHSLRHPEQERTTPNRIIAVGRACLDFLFFVGMFHGDENFVAENGNINISRRRLPSNHREASPSRSVTLDHHSFGPGSRTHTRNPIIPGNISKLRASAAALTNSAHIKYRRSLFISLLEHTGARRGEVSLMTVADIRDAIRLKHPKLKMATLKQGAIIYRFVPVTKLLLSEAIKYIDIYRAPIVRRSLKSDHGSLLVSETTGKPLSAAYLTNEMGLMRHHAKIEEQACAHMFRHAFITNLFIALIKRYQLENPSAFKHEIIMNSIFFEEIRQLTGHKDPLSLVPYIHLAFKQISGFSKVMTSIHSAKVQEIFDQKHEDLLQQLEQGMPIPEYRRRYEELVKLRGEDLVIATERET